MAEEDRNRAEDCVARAITALKTFEVPVVAWRVHATAAELYRQIGNTEEAERQRSCAASLVLQLAGSFEEGEPLRESLLGAAPVRLILAQAGGSTSRHS
jgi:hypothetical protein